MKRAGVWYGFGLVFLLVLASCAVQRSGLGVDAPEAAEDEFYLSTSLIMLKEEARIYRHLPDAQSRREFIEEFWLKRDPNPDTEENEVREEYQARLEYVERWFREKIGRGSGWDSDRGKIYLLLGAPDERSARQGNIIDRFGRPMRVLKEIWGYGEYRLVLVFTDADGFGVYRLEEWSPDLLNAIERARFTINPQNQSTTDFRIKGKYKAGHILIDIPVKGVSFDEKEEKMEARFRVVVYVYRDFKRLETLRSEHTIEGTREDWLKRKNISFNLPYGVTVSGAYLFDIIVEDLFSRGRYREMCSYEMR